MADVNATVQNAAAGIVGVIKALIVLFVFVNIIYSTGFDPIGGIVDLVNTFLDGGFAGLLALLVFLCLKLLNLKVVNLSKVAHIFHEEG